MFIEGKRANRPEGAKDTVFHGLNVACHREEWPTTRAVLVAALEDWGERGMAEVARLAHENIERLDMIFGIPSE